MEAPEPMYDEALVAMEHEEPEPDEAGTWESEAW